MREIKIELVGREIILKADFATSVKINKEVHDPLYILREAMVESMMLSRGLSYEPRFKFTVENIPKILLIGAKAAGEEITEKEMQNLVFEAGFPEAKEHATNYIAAIIGPQPEADISSEAKEESEGNSDGLAS